MRRALAPIIKMTCVRSYSSSVVLLLAMSRRQLRVVLAAAGFLLTLQVPFTTASSATNSGFRVQPSNATILRSTNHTFNCSVEDNDVVDLFWRVDGVFSLFSSNNEVGFDRGLYISDIDVLHSSENITVFTTRLTVFGNFENNGVKLECVYRPDGGGGKGSEPAWLTVEGEPNPPLPLLSFVDAQAMEISWEEPHTYADILYYSYTVAYTNVSVSTGPSMGQELTMLPVVNITNGTLFVFGRVEGLPACTEYTFDVTATNVYGTSLSGSLSAAFPIAIAEDPLVTVTSHNAQERTEINANITFPAVCINQELRYSLLLTDPVNHSTLTVLFGPELHSYTGQVVVKKQLSLPLDNQCQDDLRASRYDLTVFVDQPLFPDLGSGSYATPINCTETATLPPKADNSHSMTVIISVVVVAFVLLLAVSLIITALGFRRFQKKRKRFLLYRNDSGTGHPHRESYLISSRMPIVLVSQPRPIPISLPLVPEECMPDEDSLAVKDASLKQEGLMENNVEGRRVKLVDGDDVDDYDQPISLKAPSFSIPLKGLIPEGYVYENESYDTTVNPAYSDTCGVSGSS